MHGKHVWWMSLALLGACGGSASNDDDMVSAGAAAQGGMPGSGNTGEDSGTASEGDGPAKLPTDSTLSDEFDDATSLSDWSQLGQADTVDIDTQTAGTLTVVPQAGGWYGNFTGLLLWKSVTGDFVVETSVHAAARSGNGVPSEPYNSAGLLIRDPASRSGAENWVMHNVGFQDGRIGTEGKTTTNSGSILVIEPASVTSGVLRICRNNNSIELARKLEGESAFKVTHSYTRGDFPKTLQVGLVVNGWNSQGGQPDTSRMPDLRATFDYVRVHALTSCTEA